MQDINWLGRTKLLVGDEGLSKLINSEVLIVGLGGVGSYAAEAICRSGVGRMTIVDGDVVDPTNRNRQLPALFTTHGLSKAKLMGERLMQINPELHLTVVESFLTPEKAEEILQNNYDYVIDAIDSITPKLTLLISAYKRNLKIISSMGAGGKLDPTKLEVADISQTEFCRMAHYVRRRLRKEGIYTGIKTVFSTENVIKSSLMLTDGANYKRSAYGTISYLPCVFGCVCASVVIRDLLGEPYPLYKSTYGNARRAKKNKISPESL